MTLVLALLAILTALAVPSLEAMYGHYRLNAGVDQVRGVVEQPALGRGSRSRQVYCEPQQILCACAVKRGYLRQWQGYFLHDDEFLLTVIHSLHFLLTMKFVLYLILRPFFLFYHFV